MEISWDFMENYPHDMEVFNENINYQWGFEGDFGWDFSMNLPSSKRKHSYGIDGPMAEYLPFFLPGDFPVPHFKFGYE